MDFDDLLYQMRISCLYRNVDNVKENIKAAFQYILVDEFVDTNYSAICHRKNNWIEYPAAPAK